MENVHATIKKYDAKKMALGGGAMLSLIAIIIVGSIIPLTLDFTDIWTPTWWVNEIFVIVIAIWSVVCMMYMGQAYNAGDERSNIAKARKKFRLYNEQVIVDPFCQWVEQILEPRDQASVNKKVLREFGVKQPEVILLSKKDLNSLLEGPQRVDNHWYDEIDEEQLKVILEMKKGKYNIKFVNPRYYLTEYGYDTDLTVSERALREEKIKSRIVATQLITKVMMVLLFGIILSSFARDMFAEEDKLMNMMRLFSRLGTALSGAFVGYNLGTTLNDVTASYLDLKAEVQKEQINDKTFKPISMEEQARNKFIMKHYKKDVSKDDDKILALGG